MARQSVGFNPHHCRRTLWQPAYSGSIALMRSLVCRMLTHRFLLSGLINWLTTLFFITHMLLVFDVDVSQWTECAMSCGKY